MRTKYVWFGLVIIILLGSSIGFSADKNDFSKQGVCIVANTSVRAEPNQNGKWLSSLSLGETVKIEGNPVKDPKDPKVEYIKIRLSDGNVGFASTWCIVRGAYVAVVHRTAKIYKRPDLLALTDKNFEMLDIVAIDIEKGVWIQVTGENRTKSGWIERVAVRKDKEDIVTAVLLRKAIQGKEKTMTKEEMEQIVAKLPYPTNYFAVKMLKMYKSVETPDKNETTDADDETDTNTEENTAQ